MAASVHHLLILLSLVGGSLLDRYYHQGEKRVVNGMNARIGGFPWQVSIFRQGKLLCGGTLITLKYVMTAAHCFGKKDDKQPIVLDDFKVVLGKYNMSIKETDKRVRLISAVKLHENYQDPHKHANDIAIVTLATPVEISTSIYPACLPQKDVAVGEECFLTGWGKTYAWGEPAQVLQELKTLIVDIQKCAEKNNKGEEEVWSRNLCTGDDLEYASGCRGDSGGPLSCKNSNTAEWKVHGVVSWGDGQCNGLAHYTVYTKVIEYIPWIMEITKGTYSDACFRGDP